MDGFDGNSKFGALLEKSLCQLCQITGMEQFQPGFKIRLITFVPFCPGMDDDAARKRALGGFIAHNKMITAQSH